jgi:dienelactone hydrolase
VASSRRKHVAPALTLVLVLAGCGTSAPSGPTASDTGGAGASSTPAATPTSAATLTPMASPTPLDGRCTGAVTGVPVETATLTTSDGVSLYAATIGHGRMGLVMANDVPHSLCEELPEAQLFAEHGFRVEVFDYRDRGESGPGESNPGRLDLDVIAAAQKLLRSGTRCVVFAGSYGGAAAAIVAATESRPPPVAVLAFQPAAIRGQYIEGPFGPMGALDAAPRLRMPVLYVALRNDQFVPLPEVRRLVRATGSPRTDLVVVPSGLIGWALLDVAPSSERVQRAVFSFLRSNASCG